MFGTDMKAVGTKSYNFTFPVCNSFKPTLLRGRVCYKLELDPTLKTREGIEGGLTLMIDRNRERSVQSTKKNKTLKTEKTSLRLIKRVDKGSAEIYLPMLAPLTFSQPGQYSLFSMKKMSGTEGFLKLHHTITKCSEDKREDCENSGYLEASRKECGCLPWTLKEFTERKVGLIFASSKKIQFSGVNLLQFLIN